jgi:hypothetical protein
MPLCPQITNTPVTVTQTADFTVSSVLPVVAATTTQLDDVIILADGKTKAFYQTTAPTVGVSEGDIWFDTDDGNKQYYYNGTAWVSVQDTAIAAAQSAATAAQTTADGKNKIYRQGTTPTGTFSVGDLWFNTANDNAISRWDGSTWVANTLGNNALASISANKITAGTIDASVITVSNINAGNISTGTLAADRILAASITGAKIAANTITAANITAGTITATEIATGTITAAKIATGTITATQIAAGTITTDKLVAGTLTGFTVQTSSGTTAVSLVGADNSVTFKTGGSNVGHIVPLSSNGVLMHYGATADGSGGTFPQMFVGSANASMFASSTIGIGINTSTGIQFSGSADANGEFRTVFGQANPVANAANVWMSSTGQIRRTTASSARYKENITDLRDVAELDPKKLLQIPVRAFSYKSSAIVSEDDRAGVLIPGLIAEEVDAIYPLAADYQDGQVENINDRAILVNLLALVQDLYKEIALIKGE